MAFIEAYIITLSVSVNNSSNVACLKVLIYCSCKLISYCSYILSFQSLDYIGITVTEEKQLNSKTLPAVCTTSITTVVKLKR